MERRIISQEIYVRSAERVLQDTINELALYGLTLCTRESDEAVCIFNNETGNIFPILDGGKELSLDEFITRLQQKWLDKDTQDYKDGRLRYIY